MTEKLKVWCIFSLCTLVNMWVWYGIGIQFEDRSIAGLLCFYSFFVAEVPLAVWGFRATNI